MQSNRAEQIRQRVISYMNDGFDYYPYVLMANISGLIVRSRRYVYYGPGSPEVSQHDPWLDIRWWQ